MKKLISFAFCLLQELPVRYSVLGLMLIQVTVLEDDCVVSFKPVAILTQAKSWYKMATICFLFNPMLSEECEGSAIPSQSASKSLGTPEDTQTSFNLIESYIGSLEATINSDFMNICLEIEFFSC